LARGHTIAGVKTRAQEAPRGQSQDSTWHLERITSLASKTYYCSCRFGHPSAPVSDGNDSTDPCQKRHGVLGTKIVRQKNVRESGTSKAIALINGWLDRAYHKSRLFPRVYGTARPIAVCIICKSSLKDLSLKLGFLPCMLRKSDSRKCFVRWEIRVPFRPGGRGPVGHQRWFGKRPAVPESLHEVRIADKGSPEGD
jgi:hypothetical protein